MAYADLTAAQKKAIQDVLTPIIRPSVAEMRRIVNIWKQIVALYGEPTSEFKQALGALLAADVIPNTGNLAGASEVKKSELVSMITDMGTVVATWEDATRLGLCIKLGGINAE